ncbi:LysR substrate-binding domain-containing protein [Paraburkholderia sp. EG287A]|uniref:LysR substrate-binding domain-containing protein n=1 Tax=Paraburkholderia sp. EG287A TaxID=3237012 RepID=UPI0034D3254C
MKNVTLRQLRTFECVARHLSYSRAAEELCLTQPAVSMQLRQMEELTGVSLFGQVGKSISLTREGEALLPHARSILGRCQTAETMLQEMKSGKSRPLRLGVTTSGGYLFPRLLNAFTARQSGIEFELTVRTRDELVALLAAGDLDLAAMANAPDDADTAVAWFAHHDYVLVAAPSHPLAGQPDVDARTLAQECFFTRERGTDTRNVMATALVGHVDMSGLKEIACTEAIKQSVMSGMGLALLSAHAVQLEVQTGLLAVLDVTGFPIRRSWNLVWNTSVPLASAAEAFKDYLTGAGADLLARCAQTRVTPARPKPQMASHTQGEAAALVPRREVAHTTSALSRRMARTSRSTARVPRRASLGRFTLSRRCSRLEHA